MKANQLSHFVQLSALKWQVQPVTTFDMVRVLLPFTFCRREFRERLAQLVENITLAQSLGAIPLLLDLTSTPCFVVEHSRKSPQPD